MGLARFFPHLLIVSVVFLASGCATPPQPAKSWTIVSVDSLLARAKSGDTEALTTLKTAAEKGEPLAEYGMGKAAADGIGQAANPTEAVKWWRQAAAAGEPVAQHAMGLAYADGKGVQQDLDEAIRWWNAAASQGYGDSLNLLGVAYSEGQGIPANPDHAMKLWRMAAEKGHVVAAYNLGGYMVLYATSREELDTGVQWLKWSANAGDPGAQYFLANLYETGEGVVRDPSESLRLRELAAEQGLPEAQLTLAQAYLDGTAGRRDPATAVSWLTKAAEHQQPEAQALLGWLYERGIGVSPDDTAAHQWWQQAKSLGYTGPFDEAALTTPRLPSPIHHGHDGGVPQPY